MRSYIVSFSLPSNVREMNALPLACSHAPFTCGVSQPARLCRLKGIVNEAKEFEAHRSFLAGLSYRMLGSVAEAEDVVQDAYLRWAQADTSTIEHPRAYLARVVTRLCLDCMKSATSRC